MPNCATCGGNLSRRPRNAFRKLFWNAAFRCDDCGARWYYDRSFLAAFRVYSHCPVCQTSQLTVMESPDPVDRVSSNPLRAMLRMFGFPLDHCTFCRFQFRDWRRLDPAATSSRRREA
jgi:hypothetical protein